MVDNILVIDDDTLMHPGLAVDLERVGYLRSRSASAAEALALIQEYPPEVIFLTARQTKLDRVLRQELGAKDHVVKSFDLDVRLARIKANVAAQRALAVARWRQAWVPAAFVLGILLLVLAAPQWMGWVQNVAIHQLRIQNMAWSWLFNGLFNPARTFTRPLPQTMQTWLNPNEQMDMLTTLGIIVLAVASVAGLVRLLSDSHHIP